MICAVCPPLASRWPLLPRSTLTNIGPHYQALHQLRAKAISTIACSRHNIYQPACVTKLRLGKEQKSRNYNQFKQVVRIPQETDSDAAAVSSTLSSTVSSSGSSNTQWLVTVGALWSDVTERQRVEDPATMWKCLEETLLCQIMEVWKIMEV